jgi:hypothetical protein
MKIESEVYLSLQAYLVQSSLAMEDALGRLVANPANDKVSSALSSCLDSAKLLLTKVLTSQQLIHSNHFHPSLLDPRQNHPR